MASSEKAKVRRRRRSRCSLSSDIIMWEILPRLPVKTLCRFRCVSKSWYDLLSDDSNFLQLHWRRSKQNPRLLVVTPDRGANRIPFFTMNTDFEHDGGKRSWVAGSAADLGFDTPLVKVSACRGLVLVYNRYTVRIWNPATGDWIDIDVPAPILTPNNNPPPANAFDFLFARGLFGENIVAAIGYAESTGEYKVLISHTYHEMSWQVLTIGGSGGWRATKRPPFDLLFPTYTCSDAVVNGFIHMLPKSSSSDLGIIARFDLEEEDWSVIRGADLATPYKCYDLLLREVNGFLCLVQFAFSECGYRADIWLLKDYDKGIWVKEYTIDNCYNSYLRRLWKVEPLLIEEDGRILFTNFNLLFYYDPKSESFQEIYKVDDEKKKTVLPTLYTETFASLKRGVEVKPGQTVKCDIEVEAIFDSIVEEDATLKKAAVSVKKGLYESALNLISPAGQKTGKNVMEQAKMKAKDENYEERGLAMISNMFGFHSNVEDSDDDVWFHSNVDDDKDGVDDEVEAIFDSIVEEDATLKKAAVSVKKGLYESALNLISPAGQKTGKNVMEQAKMKAKDENYEERGLAMIRNMFGFYSNVEDSDVDDDKDGVDDEVLGGGRNTQSTSTGKDSGEGCPQMEVEFLSRT